MPQLFSRRADTVLRSTILLVLAAVAGAFTVALIVARSDETWNVGVPAAQPIPFRHDLHAGTLGLPCTTCHATAEQGAAAGMPAAETCLACHAEIWTGAAALEPLRTAAAFGEPLAWARIHRLPEHTYFHHGIHAAGGIPCAICHGEVPAMAETVKTERMSMGWCLDCHRDPAARMGWPSTAAEPAWHSGRLTDCSTCHR